MLVKVFTPAPSGNPVSALATPRSVDLGLVESRPTWLHLKVAGASEAILK